MPDGQGNEALPRPEQRRPQRRPLGLITDRDVTVGIVATGLDPETLTVRDIMTGVLVTVTEDEDFWDALALIRRCGVRRPGVGIRYGVYHRYHGVWADYENDIRQFTEGSLHVDVVDAARVQLVWEGIAQQRLRNDDFAFELDRVRTAVLRVFAELRRFYSSRPRHTSHSHVGRARLTRGLLRHLSHGCFG